MRAFVKDFEEKLFVFC